MEESTAYLKTVPAHQRGLGPMGYSPTTGETTTRVCLPKLPIFWLNPIFEPKSATAIHVRVYLWYHHKDIEREREIMLYPPPSTTGSTGRWSLPKPGRPAADDESCSVHGHQAAAGNGVPRASHGLCRKKQPGGVGSL